MNTSTITNFSLKHPYITLLIVLVTTLFFGAQFPKVHFDNDPENMLAQDEPVRHFHHAVREKFDLYDFVIVGIVNETNTEGIWNVDTLTRIDTLTKELISLYPTKEGTPAIRNPTTNQEEVLALSPVSSRLQFLQKIFSQDPNNLFDEHGNSAIITREIISPSVIDNIKQGDLGQLKIEYLMEHAPTTQKEAQAIRDDAMSNPLYRDTLASPDGKAICLYIPLKEKAYSYNVANLIENLTANWPKEDAVYITGLPVAEDTFGSEMLVQMATSAPLAGLMIFILLLIFFRRLSLVMAPMIVAIISVVSTMGLLIGGGHDVHIMSSMIAIFLMPISVADAVHILSEFYDSYHRFNDKAKTVKHVIAHLFKPMLFTSLTTMAGFASLATTPIPPVKVFGLHVAFGVGLAWLLSMTLIPALIILTVNEKSLRRIPSHSKENNQREDHSLLGRFLKNVGHFSYTRWKLVCSITLLLIGTAAYGISKIQVNDNPVKWFTKSHRIRLADRVLNSHFGGTYTAYLTLQNTKQNNAFPKEYFQREIKAKFGKTSPLIKAIQEPGMDTTKLKALAKKMDASTSAPWNILADEINYLEPESLTLSTFKKKLTANTQIDQNKLTLLLQQLPKTLQGETLMDSAITYCEQHLANTASAFIEELETNHTADPFKKTETLAYLENLQTFLEAHPLVGKTSSVIDALKKANYELNYSANARDNKKHYAIPPTTPAIAQVYTQLEGMKKKDSLFHLVSRDYRDCNLWVQLKTGDNQDMEQVVSATATYFADNPPPDGLKYGWAGLTYINIIWQEKMVTGMLISLGGSFLVVLTMMTLLFRSPLFGLLSMLPLTVTITLIYGIIGLAGKDYDMPVAVLSALTLGLSIDFAIHFLQRSRELFKETKNWEATLAIIFREPAKAISRNAIIISIGFTPLLFAPLLPYKTVGFFLATIMAVSWLGTLILLTSIATAFQKKLFKGE